MFYNIASPQPISLQGFTKFSKGLQFSYILAGAAGIEPANAGIKSRCLTAWRRPILSMVSITAGIKNTLLRRPYNA